MIQITVTLKKETCMKKNVWLSILMILFGINTSIIDAASSTKNSNSPKKAQKRNSRKKTQKAEPVAIGATDELPEGPHQEPIKRYQKNINYLTDHFGNQFPAINNNNPTASTDMTTYFAANT